MITYIHNATYAANNPTSGYFECPPAYGVEVGDVAIAWWYSRANTKSFTAPDDFVSDGGIVLYDVNNSISGHMWIGVKTVTSLDTAALYLGAHSWSSGSVTNATTAYGVAYFRGVDDTTNGGVEDDSGSPSGGLSPAIDAPAVTPTYSGSAVVCIGGQVDENDSYALPTNYSEGGHASSTSGADAWGGLAYRLDRVEAVSENPAEWTCENTAGWYAWTCALKPADSSSPLTLYGMAEDGYVFGYSTSYSTAATTANTVNNTGTNSYVGQILATGNYTCYEAGLVFQTYVIPDTDTVSVATLSLYGNGDSSTDDFDLEARLDAWYTGVGFALGDWHSYTALTGTLLAHFHSSSWTTSAYNAFTDDAFPANVDTTDYTSVLINSDQHRLYSAPTGNEYVWFATSDNAGTTNDPKLYLEFAAGATTHYGATAVSAVSAVLAGGSVAHATHQGALAISAVSAVAATGTKTIFGACAVAAVSAVAAAAAVVHATLAGSIAPAASTVVATAGHCVYAGRAPPAALSAVAIAGTVAHATHAGALSCAATSAVAAQGSVSHAAHQGAVTVAAASTVAIAGTAVHQTQQGAFAVVAVSTLSITGTKVGGGGPQYGATAVEAVSSVAAAGSVVHAIPQGALAVASVSTVAVAASVSHVTHQGAFSVSSVSSVAVAGTVTQPTHLGALTVAATSAVAAAGAVSHATLQGAVAVEAVSSLAITGTTAVGAVTGAITVDAVSTVTAVGTVVHATHQGALACAAQSSVAVAGSVAHITQQGTFAVAAASTVAVAGTSAQPTHEGALAVTAISSVTVAGAVVHATLQAAVAVEALSAIAIAASVGTPGPTISLSRVGDYIRVSWV